VSPCRRSNRSSHPPSIQRCRGHAAPGPKTAHKSNAYSEYFFVWSLVSKMYFVTVYRRRAPCEWNQRVSPPAHLAVSYGDVPGGEVGHKKLAYRLLGGGPWRKPSELRCKPGQGVHGTAKAPEANYSTSIPSSVFVRSGWQRLHAAFLLPSVVRLFDRSLCE